MSSALKKLNIARTLAGFSLVSGDESAYENECDAPVDFEPERKYRQSQPISGHKDVRILMDSERDFLFGEYGIRALANYGPVDYAWSSCVNCVKLDQAFVYSFNDLSSKQPRVIPAGTVVLWYLYEGARLSERLNNIVADFKVGYAAAILPFLNAEVQNEVQERLRFQKLAKEIMGVFYTLDPEHWDFVVPLELSFRKDPSFAGLYKRIPLKKIRKDWVSEWEHDYAARALHDLRTVGSQIEGTIVIRDYLQHLKRWIRLYPDDEQNEFYQALVDHWEWIYRRQIKADKDSQADSEY